MQDYILFKKSYEKKLYILICNFMIQKFLYPISTIYSINHPSITTFLSSNCRLHEREQLEGGLLRVHVKFLVRCSVTLPGGLGSPTGVSSSSWLVAPLKYEHTSAVCLSSTAKTEVAQVPIVTRAPRRRAFPREGDGEDAHCRTLLPTAILRAFETQQERARGSESSGLVQKSAETAQGRNCDRTDHH